MPTNPMKFINQRIGLILGMLAARALTAGAMIAATAEAAPALVGEAAPDFSVTYCQISFVHFS